MTLVPVGIGVIVVFAFSAMGVPCAFVSNCCRTMTCAPDGSSANDSPWTSGVRRNCRLRPWSTVTVPMTWLAWAIGVTAALLTSPGVVAAISLKARISLTSRTGLPLRFRSTNWAFTQPVTVPPVGTVHLTYSQIASTVTPAEDRAAVARAGGPARAFLVCATGPALLGGAVEGFSLIPVAATFSLLFWSSPAPTTSYSTPPLKGSVFVIWMAGLSTVTVMSYVPAGT